MSLGSETIFKHLPRTRKGPSLNKLMSWDRMCILPY